MKLKRAKVSMVSSCLWERQRPLLRPPPLGQFTSTPVSPSLSFKSTKTVLLKGWGEGSLLPPAGCGVSASKVYRKQNLVFSVKLQFGKTLVSVQIKFALQKDFSFRKFWTKKYKFQEKVLLQKFQVQKFNCMKKILFRIILVPPKFRSIEFLAPK